MQDNYYGREQSRAKHDILKRYLQPFASKILHTWSSIDYIDGFSGPWESRDTVKLSDTSIGVALETLSGVAEQRGHTPETRRIRCIFNEADSKAYKRLASFVEANRANFPLIKIETFEGRFEDNAAVIRHAADHQFQLVFIDPTGHRGFPPAALAHFTGRSSELIINFMRSFIQRFVTGNHEHRDRNLIEMLGRERALKLLESGVSIDTLEDAYLNMLRETLGYRFAGYSPIHNPDRNQIHFHLVYATHHRDGMEVMRTAEFNALKKHDRDRFMKDRGDDLFTGAGIELDVKGPYERSREEHVKQAFKILLEIIEDHPKGMKFGNLAATAQQSLYMRRTELSSEVVKMAEQGIVKNTWAQRNGRKPNADDWIEKA